MLTSQFCFLFLVFQSIKFIYTAHLKTPTADQSPVQDTRQTKTVRIIITITKQTKQKTQIDTK